MLFDNKPNLTGNRKTNLTGKETIKLFKDKQYLMKDYRLNETLCKSLDFDGVNEDIFVGNQSAFDFEWTQPISIEAWIFAKSEPPPKFGVFKWNGGATARGWFFSVSGYNPLTLFQGRPRLQLRNQVSGAFIDVYGNQSVTFDEWNHVVMTYDGSGTIAGIDFYINNAATSKPHTPSNPVLKGPLVGGTIRTGNDVTVNSRTAPGYVFYCSNKTEQFRMWNVQLSASDVTSLYNKSSVPQATSLIMNSDISSATFDGAEWQIPDLSGVTSGYVTRNMEINDLIISKCS